VGAEHLSAVPTAQVDGRQVFSLEEFLINYAETVAKNEGREGVINHASTIA